MLKLVKDYRIGGKIKYYLADKEINQMQIPKEITDCVCFIYCPMADGSNKLLGTGFFVYEMVTQNSALVYCITAKHILERTKQRKISIDNTVSLRVNLKEGGSTYISTKIDDWIYNTDDYLDDVALIKFNPTIDLDIQVFPLSASLSEEVKLKEGIGVGEEIFIAGLFSKYHDTVRITPIVRAGILSAMPKEKVRIEEGLIDAYLIETRSMGGLSGSPVFVNLGPTRYLGGKLQTAATGYKLFLLGIIRGHWQWGEDEQDLIIDEEMKRLNMGIAIVTPVEKIFKLIDHPVNLKAKIHHIMGVTKRGVPIEDNNDR